MKLIPPEQYLAAPAAISGRGRRPAQIDRLPKSAWRYITLMCGHVTTPERVEFWRIFRGKDKTKCFCESCGRWVKRKPQPKPTEIPAEPLF